MGLSGPEQTINQSIQRPQGAVGEVLPCIWLNFKLHSVVTSEGTVCNTCASRSPLLPALADLVTI